MEKIIQRDGLYCPPSFPRGNILCALSVISESGNWHWCCPLTFFRFYQSTRLCICVGMCVGGFVQFCAYVDWLYFHSHVWTSSFTNIPHATLLYITRATCLPPSPSPNPWNCQSVFLSYQECHINEVLQALFWDWLFSLCRMSLRSIQVTVHIWLAPFYCCVILPGVRMPALNHSAAGERGFSLVLDWYL